MGRALPAAPLLFPFSTGNGVSTALFGNVPGRVGTCAFETSEAKSVLLFDGGTEKDTPLKVCEEGTTGAVSFVFAENFEVLNPKDPGDGCRGTNDGASSLLSDPLVDGVFWETVVPLDFPECTASF